MEPFDEAPTPFARWLAAKMHERNLGMRQAAQYIGISNSMLSSYLRGLSQPTPKTVRKIAEYFHADAREVWELVVQSEQQALGAAPEDESELALIHQIDRDEHIAPEVRQALKTIVRREYRAWRERRTRDQG